MDTLIPPHGAGRRKQVRRGGQSLVRSVVFAMSLVLLTACAQTVAPAEPTSVLKPPPEPVSAVDGPLPLGRESVYELFNQGSLAVADEMLRDVWRLPRFAPVTLSPPTWHEDPYKQKYWRFLFYSLRPTSNLLWAYYRTGQAKYRTKLFEILDSYLNHDQSRRPLDIQGFDDPYALGFRAMQLTNIYVKLSRSHDIPAALSDRLRESISRTGARLMLEENFQVDHNHGFSEALALLVLHANFAELDPDGRWGDTSVARLQAFFALAVDAEGVEVEKSTFYHFYVYKFALQLLEWARANDIALPPALTQAILRMGDYAAYVTWPDGSIPLLGSSVQLSPAAEEHTYDEAMRDRPELAFAFTAGRSGTPPGQARLFQHSGQAVLRSPVDSGADYALNSQLIMDVGPPQTKHAHHEALAFNYFSGGRELLVDSGLDTYSAGQAFDYFHSNTAHNTVVVDGKDQGAGPVQAGLTAASDGWAYQSGVASVYPGVTHRRSVLLLTRDVVLVADSISGNRLHNVAGGDQRHTFEQLWHIFPGAHVVDDGLHTKVFDDHDNPVLDLRQASGTGAIQPRRYFGALDPMQGWFSAEYGRAEPNHVAGFRVDGTSAVYLTLLTSGSYAGRAASISGQISDRDVSAGICVDGYGAATIHIGAQAGPGETVTVNREANCPDVA